jgi:SiaC family regulatory phosphoprotein
MENIEIEATENTPLIKFHPKQGNLEIKGRSISENSVKFYRPLIESVEKYVFKPISPTIVHIQLDYFNTASAKCIIELLKKLESLPKKGVKVEVNWYYEANELASYHAGMDYKSILNLDFNLVKL